MNLKILYDNQSVGGEYKHGWGFSCLIDDRILFDTGEKYDSLSENAAALGVDLLKIEAVVISHDHWDHTGGLWDLLKTCPGLKVYCCPGFSEEFKEKAKSLNGNLIEVRDYLQVSPGIYSTGEITGKYNWKNISEQSIVMQRGRDAGIVTGCAHPGILNIINHVKHKLEINAIAFILGGFHLGYKRKSEVREIVENFLASGVRKAGACHCSGEAARELLRNMYGKNYIDTAAGKVINLAV